MTINQIFKVDLNKLNNQENFFNRELSWLKFNKRVLKEAAKKENPLLEKLNFIAITSSNLDEFFMIRVAGLKHQYKNNIQTKDASGLTVKEQLDFISKDTHDLIKLQYKLLNDIRKELESENIFFRNIEELSEKNKHWVERYFHDEIFPVLTPMAVDAGHPFPFLINSSLNIVVTLERNQANLKDVIFSTNENQAKVNTAVVQIPAILPRIIELPFKDDLKADVKEFIFIDDIIKNYCAYLFTGYTIKDIVPFKITRDADLEIAEEEAQDLLAEIEKSLRQRNRGNAVRLEIGKTTNKFLRQFLIDTLKLDAEDVYEIDTIIDLTCFFKFIDLLDMKNLRYESFTPQIPQDFLDTDKKITLDTLDTIDMFDEISKKDILMHHPYESFEPALNFIKQAAVDKDVLAIKQTLYRISGNSPLVRALAQAAENSKQVTVLLELKARFDEENNILWAKRLEDAGCHVIYGLIGLKTHAKMSLVVRREHNGIKRYVHMSTGNYNDKTAKLYTDLAIFSANELLTKDISNFFNVLSGYSDPPIWNKIAVAPIGLREKVKELIDEEIEFAKKGFGGHIILKMNSLLDKDMILKLYEASCYGVKIELLVRGICSLRPKVKGVSENINVISIVGRFLEHHRIFYFQNGGDEKIFLSSADLMPRNLNDRVELLFPLEDEAHIKRTKEMLEIMLKDTRNSYIMDEHGNYKRVPKRKDGLNSQAFLCQQAKKVLIASEKIQQKNRFEVISKIIKK